MHFSLRDRRNSEEDDVKKERYWGERPTNGFRNKRQEKKYARITTTSTSAANSVWRALCCTQLLLIYTEGNKTQEEARKKREKRNELHINSKFPSHTLVQINGNLL